MRPTHAPHGEHLHSTRAALGAAMLLCACADEPAAQPRLTVERFDKAAGCYVACGEAPASELNLSSPCPEPAASCELAGGADVLRVVLDFDEVPVPATTSLVPPTLTMTLDGREVTPPITFGVRPPLGPRRFFVATLDTPVQGGAILGLTATAAPGFTATFPSPLHISRLNFSVSVANCQQDPCLLPAHVGVATVEVTAPAGITETTTTLTSKLDGIPLAQTDTITLNRVNLPPQGTPVLQGTGHLTVPLPGPSRAGWTSSWQVSASIGAELQNAKPITLEDPRPVVSVVGCESAPTELCTLKAGSTAEIDVTAPLQINEPLASISVRLGGSPTSLVLTQAWNIPVGVNTRSARFLVPVPPVPVPDTTLWIIIGQVGPFRAVDYSVKILP